MRLGDARAVGYELESSALVHDLAASWIDRRLSLKWQRADDRLLHAMRAYADVRRTSAPGNPDWLAAQLALAEARLRWRECAEEIERLAEVAADAESAPY